MFKGKRVCYTVFLFFVAVFITGCVGITPEVKEVMLDPSLPQKPLWYNRTIEQKGEFIFAVGHSQPKPTLQEAEDDALARATKEVVKYCGVTVESFARSIEVSSEEEGKIYYRLDFDTQSRIIAKAFVRRAMPVQWYHRKMARMKGGRKIRIIT